jgi:demethylmenaquinone methyltransferase/2-methoxy-6-polyprenyl-1,4-benzoquinol methylase
MKLTRQFWWGVVVGLSAGSVLRGLSRRGYSQANIRRIYALVAPAYNWSDLFGLGQMPRMRRVAVQRLGLEPGASVLEVACGTGANFANLQAQIGPSGRLVGVDYTPAMLAQARRLVERRGWRNVELLQADAAQLDLGQQFDAVLCTLATTVVPGWQAALERAAAHLKPGGRLVLSDFCLSERWYAQFFNWYVDLLGAIGGADVGRRAWELLPRYLVNVGREDLLFGFLYVAWGEKL